MPSTTRTRKIVTTPKVPKKAPVKKSTSLKTPKGAKAKAAPKAKVFDPTTLPLRAAELLADKKVQDLVVYDVREILSYTDFLVVATGTSDRQVMAAAANVELTLKKEETRCLAVEGMREGRWVVIDYSDFMVHVFLGEVRDFYQFDRLWADAPTLPLPPQTDVTDRG